jgi:hypothetical protein
MTRSSLFFVGLGVVAMTLGAGCGKSRTRPMVDSGIIPGPDGSSDTGPICMPTTEGCDGLDNDCDARIDEGCPPPTCTPGMTMCGAVCVDLERDPSNCGACGNRCAPSEGCSAGACCTRSSVPVTDLDVLFVVDNSNSMTEEQESFAAELPGFVRVLSTGDLSGDGTPDFTPPSSVNFGVITSDMGTGGYTVPTCSEPNFGDDGILRTRGNTALAGCMATYPTFLSFTPGTGSPDALANDVRCVAQMGTGGCGFEQQLEAVLKAVTPSTSAVSFGMGTAGHADRENAGFLRDDAMLAVILLSDEEDCSASDPALYDPASSIYSGNLNLRCFSYPMAVHPIERYVQGLIAVKSDPSQVFFALIAGIPRDVEGAAYETILTHPDMFEMVDPSDPNRLRPSCNVPGRGLAFPPRRMVTVARELDRLGASATVGSICQESYSAVMGRILDGLADATAAVEVCR